ncbi:MAG: SDR family NAD(P)-dependent oxidoreductase, partial [Candidatus Hodarchaeales archaeon]
MNVSNKVAIVTGASKGIGRAIAYKLATLDMNLVLTSRNEDMLEIVRKEINEIGTGKKIVIPCNLTLESEIKELVDQTYDRFNKVDILVNNAGIGIFKRIDEFTQTDYSEIFDLNV